MKPVLGWTTNAAPYEPEETTLEDVLSEKIPYLVILPEREGAQRDNITYIITGVFI